MGTQKKYPFAKQILHEKLKNNIQIDLEQELQE